MTIEKCKLTNELISFSEKKKNVNEYDKVCNQLIQLTISNIPINNGD